MRNIGKFNFKLREKSIYFKDGLTLIFVEKIINNNYVLVLNRKKKKLRCWFKVGKIDFDKKNQEKFIVTIINKNQFSVKNGQISILFKTCPKLIRSRF